MSPLVLALRFDARLASWLAAQPMLLVGAISPARLELARHMPVAGAVGCAALGLPRFVPSAGAAGRTWFRGHKMIISKRFATDYGGMSAAMAAFEPASESGERMATRGDQGTAPERRGES